MSATTTAPTGPLTSQLLELVDVWSNSQHDIILAAAEFAESAEWLLAGSPTAAHWLAAVADIEICTAREWLRIGRGAALYTCAARDGADLLAKELGQLLLKSELCPVFDPWPLLST